MAKSVSIRSFTRLRECLLEELTQAARLVRPACLLTIDVIHSLIPEIVMRGQPQVHESIYSVQRSHPHPKGEAKVQP